MSYLRNKLAFDPSQMAHEAAESPAEEAQEHALGAGEEGEHLGAGGIETQLEHLLASLSPEDKAQLVEELQSRAHEPEHEAGEGEDTAGIAEAIQDHLAQNPELSGEGLSPEKAASLHSVKSAAYIDGFLNEAISRGANIKQAVDLYDNALTAVVSDLRKEAAGLKASLNKAKEKAKEKSQKAYSEAKDFASKQKSAAYYEGVFEKAAEYGLNEDATINLISKLAEGKIDHLSDAVNSIKKYLKKNRGSLGAAAGLAGGMYLGKKMEKESAYLEGAVKRAMDYGLSEHEAINAVKNLFNI
jgi:hypothetical protein